MPIALPHQNAKRLFATAQRIGKEVGVMQACELVGLTLGDRLRVTNREETG